MKTPDLPYMVGGEVVTEVEVNDNYRVANAKLRNLLGGRTPIIARPKSLTFPAALLAKTFFLNDGGLTTWSQRIPGAIAFTASGTDPVTGLPITGTGVRPYDHNYFTAAANAAVLSNLNVDALSADIPDIPQAAYPPGLTKLNAIGLLADHSLEIHTREAIAEGEEEAQQYYLHEQRKLDGEGGSCAPTRKHSHTMADVFVENLTEVDWLNIWRNFPLLRIHNLNPFDLDIILRGETAADDRTVTLTGYQCRCFRRNPGLASEGGDDAWRDQLDYFFIYEPDDPRLFWFHRTVPSFVDPPGFQDFCRSAVSSMQASNLTNFCLLDDWVREFSNATHYAEFHRNPSKLADMKAFYAGHFDTASTDPTLADVFTQRGEIRIKRLSKTEKEVLHFPNLPPIVTDYPKVTDDVVFFRGFDTIVADFAAKKIKVTLTGEGAYVFSNDDPDNDVDLIPLGTNLFQKHIPQYSADPQQASNYQVAFPWNHCPLTVLPLPATPANPRAFHDYERANVLSTLLFEGGLGILRIFPFETIQYPVGNSQDIPGISTAVANPSNRPSYRLTRRQLATQANSRRYWPPTGVQAVVIGDAYQIVTEPTAETARTLVSPHVTRVSDLMAFFGQSSLGANQNDAVTEWVNPQLVWSPEGPVYTVEERVRVEALTPSGAPWLGNTYGNKYRLDLVLNRFVLKHVMRFRVAHGFGFVQFGRDFAEFFPPGDGRFIIGDWINEVKGPKGVDFSLPTDAVDVETPVKVISRVDKQYVNIASPGQYFVKIGAYVNAFANVEPQMDGLVAFTLLAGQPTYWAQRRLDYINFPHSAGGAGARRIMGMSLNVFHMNAQRQLLNQLETGRPLDYRCLVFRVGAKFLYLDMAAPLELANEARVNHYTAMFGTAQPAPVDALFTVARTGEYAPYWDYWMAQQGITLQTSASNLPPSWQIMRTQSNETRPVQSTVTGTVSGAAFGGYFSIFEGVSFGNWWQAVITATVNWSVSDFTMGSATAIEPGLAHVCTLAHGKQGFENNAPCRSPEYSDGLPSVVQVNLNTGYTNRSWIGVIDFRHWCERAGFPFVHGEAFIPLALDAFALGPGLAPADDINSYAATYSGRVCTCEKGPTTEAPPNASTPRVLTLISKLNGLTYSAPLDSHVLRTKVIAFRLAESPGECEWKLPPASSQFNFTPDSHILMFNRGEGFERTRGKYRMRRGGFQRHPQFQVITGTNGNGNAFLNFDTARTVQLSPGIPTNIGGASMLGLYATAPVDFPASNPATHYPADNGATYPSNFAASTIAGFSSGPRVFADLEAEDIQTPSGAAAERYFNWLNREQDWMAFYIEASAGIAARQDFFLSPYPYWGTEEDWWEQSLQHYLASHLALHLDNRGVNNTSAIGNEPPRPLPTVNGQKWTVEKGLDNQLAITILKPLSGTAGKLVYDPFGLVVDL